MDNETRASVRRIGWSVFKIIAVLAVLYFVLGFGFWMLDTQEPIEYQFAPGEDPKTLWEVLLSIA